MELTEAGSTYKAASPPTSGIEDTLDVITGISQYIASSNGMPKPSKYEAYTNDMADAVMILRSSELTLPVKRISFLNFEPA